MENIKELTREQALEVLEHIWESYEDYGSSRLVHAIKYNGKYYAVKIIADNQGRHQNRTEINLFEEHGDEKFLNPIRWAYKDLMIICDYVYPIEYDLVDAAYNRGPDEFYEMCNDWFECDYTYEEAEELGAEISYVVNCLENYQGETSDNYQIGYNENDFGIGKKCVVAYDYGYTSGVSNSIQVGSIHRYLPNSCDDDEPNVYEIMKELILDEEENTDEWK